ncbi:MAG: BglG family transcription antiterminator, partial [Lachnospiraceae bacterium]|nr:BglG family transcription antiterminator [Lachnospiraceae bacterium]
MDGKGNREQATRRLKTNPNDSLIKGYDFMNFSARDGQIIQFMLEREEPVQSQEIAKRLGISVRTVQRSLPYLGEAVKRTGMMLIRNRTEGNYLTGTPTARERLLQALPNAERVDPGDRKERQRFLLFSLLKEREPRKIFYFSDLLGVSETTIASDIESLKPWLLKNRLSVIKKKGYGVFLRGSEQDYREAMRRFIEENITRGETLTEKYNDDAFSRALLNEADSGAYSFLDKEVLLRVNTLLREMNEPRLRELAENAYAGLVTHVAIAIERIRRGGFLEVPPERLSDLEEWEDYDLAVRILSLMEEEFSITIPKEEVSYVLLHLQGSKMAYSPEAAYKDKDESGVGEEELLDIIDRMIDCYNPSLAPRLKSDEDFVRGLMVHLRPVFVRLKGNMNIFNPILSNIKQEYPDVFRRCKEAASIIEDEIGVVVSDEEVGFLAMHFGAAEERILEQKKRTRRVVIGIVCASGFGVARLMMTRLTKYLSDKANLVAFGRDELVGDTIRNTDFFVSTMNLDAYGVDYLLV